MTVMLRQSNWTMKRAEVKLANSCTVVGMYQNAYSQTICFVLFLIWFISVCSYDFPFQMMYSIWPYTCDGKLHIFCFVFVCRFLGYVDKIGSAYEENSLATGYGAYIARVSEPKDVQSHFYCLLRHFIFDHSNDSIMGWYLGVLRTVTNLP